MGCDNFMKDVLDFVLSTVKVNEYVNKPQKYKTTRGQDLFGYPSEMLARASLHYTNHLENLEFSNASEILNALQLSLMIEELSLIIKKALFENFRNVSFLAGKSSIGEIILELYSQFLQKPQDEIIQMLDSSNQIYLQKWEEIVFDEENVTPEQLDLFYNSIAFPSGDLLYYMFQQSNLACAYRALPILLADTRGCRKVFDFGGNSGLLTSAMANTFDLDVCMLIDENKKMLEFAKWRDELFGVKNVTYSRKSEFENKIDKYDNFFDLGVCTEVLEHVYYVEETVENLSRILKKDGLLFISTSFGLYPEPSHLKRNLRYSGKEEELMARHGFVKNNYLNMPIPLLPNMAVYIKV